MAIDRLGLVKTSLSDYPGRVAAVLFTHGCNMECGWCHNPTLVRNPPPEGLQPREAVLRFLEKRRRVLGGVVITGGEPLMHPELPELFEQIAALGLAIKLDTNGGLPEALAGLRPDYVAMDLKLPPLAYAKVRFHDSPSRIVETIRQLRDRRIPHEFRTVWVPSWSRWEYVHPMAEALGEGALLYVAGFRPGDCLEPHFDDLPPTDLETLTEVVERFRLHGVDARLRSN